MLNIMGALRPNSEAPRKSRSRAPRGTADYINTNTANITLTPLKSQPGPIIALHWLRSEMAETANA